MPRKKSGKKAYGLKRNRSRNLLMFFVVAISFLSIFVTVNQLQKPQTTTQHASTITTAVAKPIWGCIGLGSSDICAAANDGNNFTMEENSADCLIVKGSLKPEQVEQGQELEFVFDISVKDAPECKKGFPIPPLSINAKHTKSNKSIDVKEKSDPQTLSTNALKFTAKHKIDAKEEVGEWTATLNTIGADGKPIKFPGSPDLKFTVIEPCAGLVVEKKASVDKGEYKIGETVNGTITYKNPCKSPYTVKDMLLRYMKPDVSEDATVLMDFSEHINQKTIDPGQVYEIKGTKIVDKDACAVGQKTCKWTLVGNWQKMDQSGKEGQWITNTPGTEFTINVTEATDNGTDNGTDNISKVPSGAPCDPEGKANKCTDGYICPKKVDQGGKNVCVKQTPAGDVCDPKEGNTCANGYTCQKDSSSPTGNKCLADKTAKLPADAWCDPKKGADQCVAGYTCSDKIPAMPKPPVGTPGKCIKSTSGTSTKMKKEIVYFDFNSSAVKSDYSADLGRVVTFMTKTNTSAKVRLEGNTDNVGSETYNKDLGMQRAQAVKNYLVGKGIAANRFEVISNGESKPLTPNKTATDRYRNRRVEIITP